MPLVASIRRGATSPLLRLESFLAIPIESINAVRRCSPSIADVTCTTKALLRGECPPLVQRDWQTAFAGSPYIALTLPYQDSGAPITPHLELPAQTA